MSVEQFVAPSAAGHTVDLTVDHVVAAPSAPAVAEGSTLGERLPRLPALTAMGDLTAIAAAAVVARPGLVTAAWVAALLVAVLGATRLYRSRLALSMLDDLPKILVGWLAASATLTVVNSADGLSVHSSVGFVVALGVALVAGRAATYALARRLRRTGVVAHRCVVIGTGEYGTRITGILEDHPEYGLRPTGFVAADDEISFEHLTRPVVGHVSDLAAVLEHEDVHVAILAADNVPEAELVKVVRSAHRNSCELFLIPQFAELHSVNDDTEVLWGVPLVRLRRAAHRSMSWPFKRVMDATVAGLALFFMLPLLAALAIAVRLEGGPGVIFRQTRIGIDGREFSIMKFRSLRPVNEAESATNWNISHDDRLGRVGKFIRRTSLDELPQLFNILRGDMSLVGPRPERPHFVREFSSVYPSYQSRDRVPCGLTGWAQVHGLRGDTPIGDRADFDNFYIENWSLWLDVKIMLKTLTAVVTAPGS